MKRKDFIKISSAGLAGITIGKGLGVTDIYAGTRKGKRSSGPHKKGFMLGTFPSRDDYTISEQFKMVHDAGFDGVEPDSGLDRSEVLQAKEETGLDIPSVVVSTHWSHPLSSRDPNIRSAGLDGVRTALEDAHKYGADCILLVPGIVTEDVSYDEVYRRSQAEIRKVIPMADELNVKIAIENVWNQFLLSPLEAAQFVDEFNSPSVGWYFDIGNILNFGWPEHWIRILGDRIVMIHLKEFSRQKRDDEGLWAGFRVNYMDGDNNWPAIMEALREIGYSGYGIAEPPYREEGVSVEEWLSDHVSGKLDQIFTL